MSSWIEGVCWKVLLCYISNRNLGACIDGIDKGHLWIEVELELPFDFPLVVVVPLAMFEHYY